jgi:hypothetical protein
MIPRYMTFSCVKRSLRYQLKSMKKMNYTWSSDSGSFRDMTIETNRFTSKEEVEIILNINQLWDE